jgi:hypothetical protein
MQPSSVSNGARARGMEKACTRIYDAVRALREACAHTLPSSMLVRVRVRVRCRLMVSRVVTHLALLDVGFLERRRESRLCRSQLSVAFGLERRALLRRTRQGARSHKLVDIALGILLAPAILRNSTHSAAIVREKRAHTLYARCKACALYELLPRHIIPPLAVR